MGLVYFGMPTNAQDSTEDAMYYWEIVGFREADANAFYAEAKAKNYDVEEVFHATSENDGRVEGLPYLTDGKKDGWWSVTVYVDDRVPEATREALREMAERHGMQDWGSEPSTSWEPGDRDGSMSAVAP